MKNEMLNLFVNDLVNENVIELKNGRYELINGWDGNCGEIDIEFMIENENEFVVVDYDGVEYKFNENNLNELLDFVEFFD